MRLKIRNEYEQENHHHHPRPADAYGADTNPHIALAAYGIRSYPELIVIDSKGTIVACPRNVEELGSVLKKLHNQH